MTRTVVRKAALPLTLLAAMFASSALAQTTPVPMPGWPVSVGAPIGAPQLAIADVNANGQLEIVVPTLAVGLVVYQADGSVLPGWAGGVGLTYNRVVVGNLVGDAKLELVAMRGGGGSQTRFDAYDSTGLALPGWPLTFQPMNSSPIIVSSNTSWALGDIDGDGYDEFVFLSEEEHRLAYAYDGDGSLVPGWPVSLVIPPTFPGDEFGLGGIAIADLEFDGVAEVLVTYEGELSGVGAVNGPLWVFDGDGAVRTGWPQAIAGVGPPFVVDLDRDYTPEIVQMGESWIRSVKPDGTVKFDGLLLGSVFILPVVGDLEGNGSREIVVPSWFDARVVEYGTLGIPPHFQIAATENAHANYRGPSLGDVDGDGDLEIAMWSQPDLNPQSDMILQLWHHDFTPVAGWPMTISPAVGTNFGNSTQMADLDGDGDAEIILGYHGSIHVWNQPAVGTVGRGAVWGARSHNAKGNYNFHEGSAPQPTFTRGDANGDSTVNVTDVIFQLRYLYLGEQTNCVAALDVDGDEQVSPLDAFALLDTLFTGLFVPEAPYPSCEAIPPGPLSCMRFECP